jgi:hypothetical protein
MRKILLLLSTIVVLSLVAIYLLVPKLLIIKGTQAVNQSAPSVIRGMMQTDKWWEWMPKETTLNMTSTMVATIQTELTLDEVKVPVEFSIIDDTSNNAIIGFETSMENTNWSPIARVQNYLFAKKIQGQLDLILSAAGNYYNTVKGVYGFEIQETNVQDSSLIALDQVLMDTPTLVQLYEMVAQLEQHIIAQNGIIKNDPMVNITRINKEEVYTQVAIPIEKDIQVKPPFTLKKMVLGKLLSVAVIGDAATVNSALVATKQYLGDKQKTSPAIPYVIYNTNRMKELDAQKWKSTINYPVF